MIILPDTRTSHTRDNINQCDTKRKHNKLKNLTFHEIATVDHGFVRMFDLNIETWKDDIMQHNAIQPTQSSRWRIQWPRCSQCISPNVWRITFSLVTSSWAFSMYWSDFGSRLGFSRLESTWATRTTCSSFRGCSSTFAAKNNAAAAIAYGIATYKSLLLSRTDK